MKPPRGFCAPEEAFFVLVPDKPKPIVKEAKTRGYAIAYQNQLEWIQQWLRSQKTDTTSSI